MRNKTVVIVQPYVPHYRLPFFNSLFDFLKRYEITLIVAVARPTKLMSQRGDATSAEWMRPYKAGMIKIGGKYVRIGTAWRIWKNADAVIVPDYGSSLDTNLACARLFGPKAVGIWGHIKSYVNRANRIDKAAERWQLRNASHVFAYVNSGALEAQRVGVAIENITVVMNTIDVSVLLHEINKRGSNGKGLVLKNNDINPERTLGYIGGLDSIKRIPFLCETLDKLWEIDPSIKILVCGNGQDAKLLDRSVGRGQAIMLGYADAVLKAEISCLISALLSPGAIGLVAVDALVFGKPILTTYMVNHGPEAEYLIEGVSKITSNNDVSDYVNTIIKYLDSPHKRENWGFPRMEEMVENFGSGILKLVNQQSVSSNKVTSS